MVAFKHPEGLFVFVLKDLYSEWMAKHAQVSNFLCFIAVVAAKLFILGAENQK